MITILRNRFLRASAYLLLSEIIGAFAIMAPLLVYFRLQFELSLLVKEFWPIITPDLLADIIINYNQALAVFLLAGFIIYLAYFPLKSFLVAGIYSLLVSDNQFIGFSNLMRSAYNSWIAFMKISLFAVLIYLGALFIGLSIGSIFESFSGIIMISIAFLFLLSASSYIQILRLQIILSTDSSIKSALINTRQLIRGNFLRIVIGNISVTAVAFVLVLLLWLILKNVRGFDWNILTAVLSFIIQQLMVFAVCLGQVIRINFHLSLFRRGEHDVMGRT